MHRASYAAFTVFGLSLTGVWTGGAQAQESIALKSGESIEIGSVWWVAHCRSIMVNLPEVEILEGPPGLTLSLKKPWSFHVV
jgi:hypothetical protein